MVRVLAAALAFLAATFVALPAEAQWKWRDKSGHTQYSDLPPPSGTPEQDILSKPGAQRARAPVMTAAAASATAPGLSVAAPAASGLTPRVADPELEARRKKQDADQAAKVKAEETRIVAAKADNCVRARQQLATVDSGIRLARANDKGEREILDDKARAEEAKRARDVIAADCK